MKRFLLAVFVLIPALFTLPSAQMRVVPLDEEQGHVALGLALRHLNNVGIFMHTTAHPDDENNGLLVMLNRGQGYRTALATATRGNGGQNEICPEIFEALGLLRTGELAALHRFDGAEQYFTRAVDFGYSFSIEETFEKWGKDEITADYVRLIRTIRPDVIITLPPTGNAGGQHHMASAPAQELCQTPQDVLHSAVVLASDVNFESAVKNQSGTTVVLVSGGCVNCATEIPVFEKVAETLAGSGVHFVRLHKDASPEGCAWLSAKDCPAIVIVENALSLFA